jgi:ubiquitin thioesterase protein OTUB1
MENSWRCSYKLLEMVAEQGVEFHSNILNFCRSYSEFRPVHGDGGCFYRSFIFSYLVSVLLPFPLNNIYV